MSTISNFMSSKCHYTVRPRRLVEGDRLHCKQLYKYALRWIFRANDRASWEELVLWDRVP